VLQMYVYKTAVNDQISIHFYFVKKSCATAAQYPEYHVHSGQKIVGKWRPTRGW